MTLVITVLCLAPGPQRPAEFLLASSDSQILERRPVEIVKVLVSPNRRNEALSASSAAPRSRSIRPACPSRSDGKQSKRHRWVTAVPQRSHNLLRRDWPMFVFLKKVEGCCVHMAPDGNSRNIYTSSWERSHSHVTLDAAAIAIRSEIRSIGV